MDDVLDVLIESIGNIGNRPDVRALKNKLRAECAKLIEEREDLRAQLAEQRQLYERKRDQVIRFGQKLADYREALEAIKAEVGTSTLAHKIAREALVRQDRQGHGTSLPGAMCKGCGPSASIGGHSFKCAMQARQVRQPNSHSGEAVSEIGRKTDVASDSSKVLHVCHKFKAQKSGNYFQGWFGLGDSCPHCNLIFTTEAMRSRQQAPKPRCGPCDMMGSPCALHEVLSSDEACPNCHGRSGHYPYCAASSKSNQSGEP